VFSTDCKILPSNHRYHDDYDTHFRGNLIPLPETMETRLVLRNSKLLNQVCLILRKICKMLNHFMPGDPTSAFFVLLK